MSRCVDTSGRKCPNKRYRRNLGSFYRNCACKIPGIPFGTSCRNSVHNSGYSCCRNLNMWMKWTNPRNCPSSCCRNPGSRSTLPSLGKCRCKCPCNWCSNFRHIRPCCCPRNCRCNCRCTPLAPCLCTSLRSPAVRRRCYNCPAPPAPRQWRPVWAACA